MAVYILHEVDVDYARLLYRCYCFAGVSFRRGEHLSVLRSVTPVHNVDKDKFMFQ